MSSFERADADGAFFDPKTEMWPIVAGELIDGEPVVTIRYGHDKREDVFLPFETAATLTNYVAGAWTVLEGDGLLMSGQYGELLPTNEHAYLSLKWESDQKGRLLGLVGVSGRWWCSFGLEDAPHVARLLNEAVVTIADTAIEAGIELPAI